jgi:protocatechuate 3,4-dioxygenase, beta subunit
MKLLYVLAALLSITTAGCSQTNGASPNKRQTGNIGGRCEGCEAIYECDTPFEKLHSMAWMSDWKNDVGIKLAINGTVYKADGKTPAPDVIIYIYHTDQTGVYPKKGDELGWAKRHGYLRAWMKTDSAGFYKFFTLRPASYPNSKIPAHIHMTIKEPGKNEYYVDEILFDDDPFLTPEERKKAENRGGSGIITFKPYYVGKKSMKSERNIYLGQNIPNYPDDAAMKK